MSIAIPFTIYGYNIIVPEDHPLTFIHDLISINDTLDEPIQVYCITPNLTMMSVSEVQVIIGFIPHHDLSKIMIHVDALREFIMDNPMFDGIDMDEKPAFYAGFKWEDDIISETVSDDSDTISDSISDDCDSSDESDSDNSDNSDSNDETHDKSISYYVSKYYI